ncbi:DUF2567 domain-containing protein [Rhodococcus sovatensis]|uniref:DUF2567 domain-containing protein n=1 Tax=Rhodococcus sovatensis TaxID=1805840 RepID=A0ABZ2PMW0_9NOCA
MTLGPPQARDVRSARVLAVAVAVSVLFGIVGGLVWGAAAPPEQFVVVDPGRGAALTGESLHRFDGIAIFVCISFVAGIVVPVALWTWTSVRGPVLFLGVLVGAALGSSAMLGVGIWLAGLIDPSPDNPQIGSVVSVAPGFESPLVLVVQPLLASLVVLLLAAMNPHDNLRFTPNPDPELPLSESDEIDVHR